MNLELLSFSPSRSTDGAMIGLAVVRFVDVGINLHEVRVSRRRNGHLSAKASRLPIVKEGLQLRSRDSNELRWGHTFTFRDEARFIEFSECVVQLVRQRHPEMFTTADAGVLAQPVSKPTAVPCHQDHPSHA